MSTISRVVGSGFTTLNFNGKVIARLQGFNDNGQSVAFGPETVYSIGNNYADEVVTSRVMAPGTLVCEIREAWHAPVWKTLLVTAGLAPTTANGMNNIVDAYAAIDAMPDFYAQMVIKNPNKGGGYRGKVFHDLTITDLDDGENVTVGGLSVPRRVTFTYIKATHFTGAPDRAVARR